MGILSRLETVSTSPLPPAEVLEQLQKSILPLANQSWRDDYQIDPAFPFQGTIVGNSFEFSRIDISRTRSRKPLTITGQVLASPSGDGSIVRLRYYRASMWWIIAGLSAMAISFCTAAVLQDLRTVGHATSVCVMYVMLPIWGAVAQYYGVKNEMTITQPLLTRLLQLKPVRV